MKYLENLIENDHKLANEKDDDLTKNDSIMLISFLIKLVELVSLIFTVSYLFALLWMKFSRGSLFDLRACR